MSIDEFVRRNGRGAQRKLELATELSGPTIRKAIRHEPVRLDTAAKLAKFLGCSTRALTHPRPLKPTSKKGKVGG